jgi:hypothetical protein
VRKQRFSVPDFSGLVWRKSSRSTDQGECVEVGVWRRHHRSTGNGGEPLGSAVAERLCVARDSKNPDGPVLAFTVHTWSTFIGGVKAGTHDPH